MDYSLRCNSLKCRTQLDDRAVVTTCSHIFCVPCSDSLGLSNPNGGARICPACQTQLPNPDDAVLTQLDPTEDYKTSVLSGLSPSIIMECAGRGLSFYSYQTTQEIVYQEFLAKSLTDKYSTLSSQMDKIIHDANSEITNLRDKLSAMHVEKQTLEQKNHDLAEAFREKSKNQQQLQKLYQRLKQQQVAAGLEFAADNDAEHVLFAAAGGLGGPAHRSGAQPSRGSNGSINGGVRRANTWNSRPQGSRSGLQSSRNAPLPPDSKEAAKKLIGSAPIPPTPSGHRTRLPAPLYGNNGSAMGIDSTTGEPRRQATPFRQPLGGIDPNTYGSSNAGGFGMSAGVKIGRQQNGPISRSSIGMGRSSASGGLNIR